MSTLLRSVQDGAVNAASFSFFNCLSADPAINPAKFYVEAPALDAVGLLGGYGYATRRIYFDLPTVSLQDWERDPGAASRRRSRQ